MDGNEKWKELLPSMNHEITINLYADWLETVKQVFRGSGQPLPEDLTPDQVALAYFLQTAPSKEEALRQRDANEARLTDMQQKLLDNFEAVVLPDLRGRTGYEGTISFSVGYSVKAANTSSKSVPWYRFRCRAATADSMRKREFHGSSRMCAVAAGTGTSLGGRLLRRAVCSSGTEAGCVRNHA